jgi:hypothetical protein
MLGRRVGSPAGPPGATGAVDASGGPALRAGRVRSPPRLAGGPAAAGLPARPPPPSPGPLARAPVDARRAGCDVRGRPGRAARRARHPPGPGAGVVPLPATPGRGGGRGLEHVGRHTLRAARARRLDPPGLPRRAARARPGGCGGSSGAVGPGRGGEGPLELRVLDGGPAPRPGHRRAHRALDHARIPSRRGVHQHERAGGDERRRAARTPAGTWRPRRGRASDGPRAGGRCRPGRERRADGLARPRRAG